MSFIQRKVYNCKDNDLSRISALKSNHKPMIFNITAQFVKPTDNFDNLFTKKIDLRGVQGVHGVHGVHGVQSVHGVQVFTVFTFL